VPKDPRKIPRSGGLTLAGRGVNPIDWDNPRLRQIGKQFAAEAYTLADELNSYGADATQLLLPQDEQADRPWGDVCLPRAYANVLHAVLLSLPRKGERRGRRSRWSLRTVEALIESGVSVRSAAKAEAARTGVSATTIERSTRSWRARHKQGGAD
jgi:hypothetical protein